MAGAEGDRERVQVTGSPLQSDQRILNMNYTRAAFEVCLGRNRRLPPPPFFLFHYFSSLPFHFSRFPLFPDSIVIRLCILYFFLPSPAHCSRRISGARSFGDNEGPDSDINFKHFFKNREKADILV